MDSSTVYYITFASIAALLVLLRIAHGIRYFHQHYLRPWYLRHLAYARWYGSIARSIPLLPEDLLDLLLQTFYVSGTVVVNLIGVKDLPAAASRAAQLALGNLVPLYFCHEDLGVFFLGVSISRYSRIHQNIGIMVILQAVVHGAIRVQKEGLNLQDKRHFYGFLAAIMLVTLLVCRILKRRLYELFLKLHTGCALFLLYALWKHINPQTGSSIVLMVMCVSLFGGSFLVQVIRVLYRNVALGRQSARSSLVLSGNTIQVHLMLPRPWKIRAGERINLAIPSAGLTSLFQSHPFVIVWWENDIAGNGVSIFLLVRPRTGFTRKLRERLVDGQQYLALVDGPYGIARHGVSGHVGDYGHVFMVTTGIGIAAGIPYIKELLEGRRGGKVKTQRISLVWQLEQNDDYSAARNWLQNLVSQDGDYQLRVLIFHPARLESPMASMRIGEHNMIEVQTKEADWEKEFLAEAQRQIGTMLVIGRIDPYI
ncbi:hypothetical protein Plec18167_006159 [Paecilomyces lecythidis]|uniref:FAD-binding FR-type domain-containing protein n=1 Tax=Paecilomyces lecythidis TaxID=3004212 RepID=A0ABR3XD85_9EURO